MVLPVLYVDVDSLQALADVINQLNALDIVEFAYASDLPAPPPEMDDARDIEWVDYWKGNDLLPWPTAEEIKELETGMDPPPLTPPTEKSAVPAPDVTLTIEPPPLPGN